MRRKIACFITAGVTIAMMALRVFSSMNPTFALGSFSLEDGMIALSLILFLAVTILCFSKKETAKPIGSTFASLSGWISTFAGAMLIMSVVLDTFSWLVYHQVPPPNDRILNNVDFYTLNLSLIMGLISGVFFILQGFQWMANTKNAKAALSWLSLSPILWMWFRLARYEISYASTIDISHSFFDFAVLVTASLFFLQLAKSIIGRGAQPKNALLIFSLFTVLSSLSATPMIVLQFSQNVSANRLLSALVDIAIGALAFVLALEQIFGKAQDMEEDLDTNEADDSLAWTTPVKERKPLDPPFSLDQKLPELEPIPENTENEDDDHAEDVFDDDTDSKTWTVDDILAELDKDSI